MEIVLSRVDSRLIHGQVVTKWLGQSGANRIIVISDELEKDDFMKDIYAMAAPPGIKVDIFGVKSAGEAWRQEKLGDGKILLIIPNIKTLEDIINEDIRLDKVQVGGLGGGPDRKVVFQNITLNDADVEILKSLDEKGVNIYFQTIPEDSPQKLSSILEKY